MPGRFEAASVLVTGGGSGIGRATALAFAAEGARVIIADIAETGGRETARMIEAQGGQAAFLHADMRDAASVEAMVRLAAERWGRLDCAFNNAGIGGPTLPLADYAEADYDAVLDTNMRGVFLCLKHELLIMVRQGGGCIINTASMAAFGGSVETGPYSASKAAVVSLTRSAAKGYARHGIRVNAICPGATDTPLPFRRTMPREEFRAQLNKMIPLGRMAQADEIAHAVLWLCSSDASYVTGHMLVADGGLIA